MDSKKIGLKIRSTEAREYSVEDKPRGLSPDLEYPPPMSVEFVTCFLKLFSCHGSDCVRVVRTELAWEAVWSRFLVRHIYILHTYYKGVKELGGKFF